MILLYTPKITSRIQYAVKFILGQIGGFEYSVTSSSEDFINFKGARINYSDRHFPVDCIHVFFSGFLIQKGVREFAPPIRQQEPWPCLFPAIDDGREYHVDYDIFASAFYLMSRYEEYLPFLEDRYGRFEADQSYAFQHGFLELPITDLQALELQKKLLHQFPFLEVRERKFRFIPTYDIDVAYAYKGRGTTRNVLAIVRDVLTFNFQNLHHRTQVLLNRLPDPFDTYDLQLSLQKHYQLDPIYFFLSAQFGPRDKNISIYSRHFSHLLKRLGDYAQTGIHPSFASHEKPARLLEEIKTLASILNRTVEKSRQHYLKLHLPETYTRLMRYNIWNDYSMGFASHPGFRAGTCTPFNFFNLQEESETRLKVHPLAVMDGSLRDYLKLSPDEAIQKCEALAKSVMQAQGTFITLWHNDALSEYGYWKGWRKVYTHLIDFIHNPSGEKKA